ncbi:MAG: hypothetical protein F9K30_21905 [Dechloromonas sp.]|nr:MAG: hypothetical protein F9K30_21905 [Dechloromonas sp.]
MDITGQSETIVLSANVFRSVLIVSRISDLDRFGSKSLFWPKKRGELHGEIATKDYSAIGASDSMAK